MLERLPFTSANAPSRSAALQLSFQERLDQSQWWSPDAIRAYQLRKLAKLCQHAWQTIPFYRERLAAAGFRPGVELRPDCWRHLARLTRREIRALGEQLQSPELPEDHGRIFPQRTAGSTGTPIGMLATTLTQTLYNAIRLREPIWHRRDFSRKLAIIRRLPDGQAPYPEGEVDARWADERVFPFPTGPLARLNACSDPDQQIEWLQRQGARYLLTHPSNLRTLVERCRERSIMFPSLAEIATEGEVVSQDLRDACRTAWKLPVVDHYEAEEAGYIALQCPDGGGYHIQSEVILAEILDESGRACRPGEIGRVTVTPLFNYAMPMLRYELDDCAEVGEACTCGRGLPTLHRILGRLRNSLILPGGERCWPDFGAPRLPQIAPILQHQFVQTDLDRIEARLVVARPLSEEDETRLRAHVLACLPCPFRIDLVYWAEIPRGPGGKQEDFISEIAAARALAPA